jgi:hypothetical protein
MLRPPFLGHPTPVTWNFSRDRIEAAERRLEALEVSL